MTEKDLIRETRSVLAQLPRREGGIAVILATASAPPAVAILSTGDVYWGDETIRVGIHATSSAVTSLGGAFTLVVPLGDRASRIQVIGATSTIEGPLALIEGTVANVRPTAEPPWALEMRFRPDVRDDPRLDDYVTYWQGVTAWLSGESSQPPRPPS